VEVVSPLAENLGDELRVPLCHYHRRLPVIRFIYRLAEFVFQRTFQFLLLLSDLRPEEVGYLLATLVYVLAAEFVR
jgi:hypothetical protein